MTQVNKFCKTNNILDLFNVDILQDQKGFSGWTFVGQSAAWLVWRRRIDELSCGLEVSVKVTKELK